MIALDYFEGQDIGPQWRRIPGCSTPVVAFGSALSRSGVAGAYRVGEFPADQFSQGILDLSAHTGLRVRQSPDEDTCYWGMAGTCEAAFGPGGYAGIVRCIRGHHVQIAETRCNTGPHLRLSARGTRLTLEHAPESDGPWSVALEVDDGTIGGGAPGFAVYASGAVSKWRGGAL